MELKKGIMLYNDCDETYSNITINAGTVHHSEHAIPLIEYGNYSYYPLFEDDAYVAKPGWRSLTPKEINTLKPTSRRNDTNTVYTGKLPDKLIDLLEQLKLKESTSRAEVFERFKANKSLTEKVNKEMEAFLNSIANGKPHKILYLGTNLPNMEVVACDTTVMPKGFKEEEKKYLGIHNDGTYYVPFNKIRHSGNRVTINLGLETRHFMFINLTMSQAYNMIRKNYDLTNHKVDVISISKYFFSCFSSYPVLRIEQKPYEYYIAATDNCFHDGTTLGKKELDIVLAYLGAFQH
ncbi:MAG: hypothetical protein JNM68_00795 [Dinghuibacter sp.]|nr:hypothetical protein [Dinghuibacter sp.]